MELIESEPGAPGTMPASAARPTVREIPFRDPFAVFSVFAEDRVAVFLDSALLAEGLGRYSFIGCDPFRVLTSKDGQVRVDDRPVPGDPFDVLAEQMARFRLDADPDLPFFQGGAAGYLGYDLGRHLERVPVPRDDSSPFPDMALGLFDVVLAFDQRDRRAWILSSGLPETEPDARQARALARADAVAARLAVAPATLPALPNPATAPQVEANFTRPDYEAAVQRVIDYILAGDIFQANMTQRFQATLPPGLTPFGLYHRLRRFNPAPFGAYLRFGETVIASSSPERFIALRDGRVETRPIKGTARRGLGPEEDAALSRVLRESKKDQAENVMIVDLLRNDLSRVCRDGSVEVPSLCALERYATVYHLVSTITGELRPGTGAIDLLKASFPGGSITGAPKIRAMEIIAELEPTRRGPYCGSIVNLGFDGSMDSNIVIRTFAIDGDRVSFQAGGGIVADSDPRAEYEETLAKARALVAALSPNP